MTCDLFGGSWDGIGFRVSVRFATKTCFFSFSKIFSEISATTSFLQFFAGLDPKGGAALPCAKGCWTSRSSTGRGLQ